MILNNDFLDNGYWTPQTVMLRAIQEWVSKSDLDIDKALSIDNNPTLDEILLSRWPDLQIDKAVLPEVDAMNMSHIKDGTYDLVYSHQVLEHISKPWIAAKEIIRVLRPSGLGIHTTCSFNPRHGPPQFLDYYRFLVDGLVALFDDTTVLAKGEWGNREAILYNVGINDGHGNLGGRRFHEAIGSKNDNLYPWHTWIIFQKHSD